MTGPLRSRQPASQDSSEHGWRNPHRRGGSARGQTRFVDSFLIFNTKASSAASATSPLAASTISRRDPGPRDVRVDVLFCGVCHSDLHYVRNEWKEMMPAVYPCVPRHEIVGRVASVGSAVTKFKGGDLVGVGCPSTPAARALSARRGWGARRNRPPVPQGDAPSE